MDLKQSLKEYKKNVGKIETVEERCKYWQYCLDTMTDDEIAKEFEFYSSNTFGMPKTNDNTSPVEGEVILKEVTREMVKQWIKDDKSRIYPLKLEVKQINIALGSLTEEENYIIETKCIYEWKWKQVEIGFNEKFRNKREITEEQLRKKKREALKKMNEIINT